MKYLNNILAIVSLYSAQTSLGKDTPTKDAKGKYPAHEDEKHDDHEHDHDHSETPSQKEKPKAGPSKDAPGEHPAQDDHLHNEGHSKTPEHKEKPKADRHGDDEHGHGEEKANVGPGKGVLEADEHNGFKLNPSAEKNFAIQMFSVPKAGAFDVPAQALLFSGMEKQVFRSRNGHWKAVDIKVLRRDAKRATIESKDLLKGDSIAISGVGFLKIVEQSVFGPAIEGHVH